jgi:hypothetical protein
MSGRTSRIQRKAARVEKTESEHEFDVELGQLRTALNDALRVANEAHRNGTKKLDVERKEARGDAYKAFEDRRGKLLKRLAAKERTRG